MPTTLTEHKLTTRLLIFSGWRRVLVGELIASGDMFDFCGHGTSWETASPTMVGVALTKSRVAFITSRPYPVGSEPVKCCF